MPVQPEKRSGDPQVRIAAREHPVISLSAGRITVQATVVQGATCASSSPAATGPTSAP